MYAHARETHFHCKDTLNPPTDQIPSLRITFFYTINDKPI